MVSKTPKSLNRGDHHIRLELEDGPRDIPIVIRKHARSRQMVMRYQPLQHHIALTLPRFVTISQGLDFVRTKERWLLRQVKNAARGEKLIPGARVPVMGDVLTLVHVGGRGVTARAGDELRVTGDADFFSRRVKDWLKAEVLAHIEVRAHERAALLNVKPKKIGLRDPKSRWGSCNYSGHLSFSWRLVFAPREVLEYVICHEVAHLKHMDHSPAFWMAVERLMPGYEPWRIWLRDQGMMLYGFD